MKRDGMKWLIGKRMGGASGSSGNAGKERGEKEGGGEPLRWEGSVRMQLGMDGNIEDI